MRWGIFQVWRPSVAASTVRLGAKVAEQVPSVGLVWPGDRRAGAYAASAASVE